MATGWRRGGRERVVVARLVGCLDEEEQQGSRPQQAALPDAAARCPCQPPSSSAADLSTHHATSQSRLARCGP